MSDTPISHSPPCEPTSRFQARAVRCLLAAYWLAMLVGTHWPKPHLPDFDSPLKIDKVLHFSGYFGLSILLFTSVYLSRRRASLLQMAVGVGLLIAGYGVLDEMTQPYFNRVADWTDWVADLLGCATGLACAVLWVRGSLSSAEASP
jgi:VanZ family protein